jgi:murein DD-endopeptidase MepM/ murein hydrolase activator NlpD
MRFFGYMIPVILIFGLTACQTTGVQEQSQADTTPTFSSLSTIKPPTVTGTKLIVSSVTQTAMEMPTRIRATDTPQLENSPTSSPIPATPTPQSQVSSPLQDHDLSLLPGIISAPYDPPRQGSDERHQGVDFAYYHLGERATIQGVPILPIFPGRVALSLTGNNPYGNFVIIETPQEILNGEIIAKLNLLPGESLYHLYAHLGDEPLVELGEWVTSGTILGHVGETGYWVTVPHLHLETRLGPAGTTFEVMDFYHTQTSEEERANYTLWRTSGVFRHFDPMLLLEQP